jgi:phage replication-related protein YjqB (UPF0714/DUF867 family)
MTEFSNYRELSLNRKEGRDFEIRKKQRGSAVATIAPHGGTIEPVTSKLVVARLTPMRANIVGPPRPTTNISAAIDACHSSAS